MSLRRSGFAPKWSPRPPREWTGALPTARKTVAAIRALFSGPVVSRPKENAIQSEAYMAAARTLACRRCGFYRKGFIQFCHTDASKGMGIKTDCRRGWAGCGPHDDLPGCHWHVGTSGRMGKQGRREFESFAAMSTRAEIEAKGLWPKRLARWPG